MPILVPVMSHDHRVMFHFLMLMLVPVASYNQESLAVPHVYHLDLKKCNSAIYDAVYHYVPVTLMPMASSDTDTNGM